MNSKLTWWFCSYLTGMIGILTFRMSDSMKLFLLVFLAVFLFSSTEQYTLLDSIRQNEQTTEPATSIPLITKPNSYLYDPNDDDDDDELDRVKRDAAPFVCKGNRRSQQHLIDSIVFLSS